MPKKDTYDMESRKIDYETYKPKGAPSARTTDRQIENGNEKAYDRAEKAFREANDERRREINRSKRNESAASGKSKLDTRHNKY